MIFDYYRERGAALAADVVNTRGSISGRELLEDEQALAGFLRDHDLAVDRGPDAADLAEFRRLRDRLHAIFFADGDEATAELLNSALRDYDATLQVARGGNGWEIQVAAAGGGPVQNLAAAATAGMAALFSDSGRSRFGICSADDCRDVFIDGSRNRSRRYCDDSCSSRTNVAAFRARRRSTSP